MMKKIFVLITFILLLTHQAVGAKYDVFVNRVIDGDTFDAVIINLGFPVRIRLADIDAFELRRDKHSLRQQKETHKSAKEAIALAKDAKQFLEQQIGQKVICVEINTSKPTGVYGRYIATVWPVICERLDSDTISINRALLKNKLAIPYQR